MAKRAAQQAQTRAEILDAAELEFEQRGVADVTLDDIAKRAGFTKGAIYSNFDSKNDLLFAVLERRKLDVGNQYIEAALNVPDRDLGEVVGARAAKSQREDIVHQRVLVALWSASMGDAEVAVRFGEMRQAHRNDIADAVRDRAEAAGVELKLDIDHLALGLNGMSMAMLFDAAINPDIDAGAAFQTMIDVVLHGVVNMD